MPLPLYQYDNPQQNPPAASGGSKLPLYNYGPVAPAPAPLPKKPGILDQARTAASNMTRKLTEFVAGAAEAPKYTGAKGEVLRNLPGEIVRTILPGAAALHDNPELAAKVTNMDIAKEVPGVVRDMFVKPLVDVTLTGYGAGAQAGLKLPGTDKTGAVTVDIPGLGKVSNVQARIAEDFKYKPVPDTSTLLGKLTYGGTVAMYTGEELLNGLYAYSLLRIPFAPRHSVIAKREAPEGITVKQGPKSGQLYQPPVGTRPIPAEVVQKLMADGTVPIKNFNAALPTYFRLRGTSGGKAVGEIVQVRPSYFNTFMRMLKGDISKVPKNQLIVVGESARPLAQIKPPAAEVGVIPPPVVPSTAPIAPAAPTPVVPEKPVTTPPIEPTKTLSTPETPIVNPPQPTTPAPISSTPENGPLPTPLPETPPPLTQKERVMEAVAPAPLSIKEVAKLTKILEPNVRRILGVGTKEGVFHRVSEGVYVLKNENGNFAYVELGDAEASLARMASEGQKFDSVILDPAYFSRALIGGNRGIKQWNFIQAEQFAKVMQSVAAVTKGDDSHIYLMLSGARTAQPDMAKYIKAASDAGLKVVGEGTYTKLFQSGKPVTNVRGEVAAGERLILLTKSGTARKGEIPAELNFRFVRPSIAKSYQTEKPAELMKALIQQSTLEGETVLDPFAGSGVTGAEALKAGRNAVLVEKQPETVEKFTKPRVEAAATPEAPKEGKNLTIKPAELKKEMVRELSGNLKRPVAEIKGQKVVTPDQLITKTDLRAAIKAYPGEEAVFTVREVDGQKRLELEAEGRKVSMRPRALGLVEDNIAVGDKVTITAKDLAPKGTALRAYDGEEVVASLAKKSGFEKYDERTIQGDDGFSDWKQIEYRNAKGDEITGSVGRINRAGEKLPDNYTVRLASGKYITKPSEVSPGQRQVVHFTSLKEAENAVAKPQALNGDDASLASDLKEGVVEPAKSVDELKAKIDQLNKFGQSQAILRRTGGLSTKYGGVFRSIPKDKQGLPNPKNIAARGQIHLQDSVVGSPRHYMETLAHELGHALDYTINGNTSNTIRIFGKDLPDDVKKTIIDELKANTNKMVGEANAKKGAGYYYKPTELFARFLENMFAKPGEVADLAPTAMKYLEMSAIENPIIQEYLEAVYSQIDKGERKHIFLRDMKQVYQKYLGTRVGEMAWNDEMRYRAMKERAKVQVEKLVKAKFKNVKDDPATLFRAAESIKVTKDNAPVYGTRDFKSTNKPKEAHELQELGWEAVVDSKGNPVFELKDGEQMMKFAKPRYTAAESKRIFDSLSPEGQQLIKDFTAAKDEAKDYFNREMIKDVHKINTDLEGWVHRYWEDKGAGAGGRMLKTKVAAAQKFRKGAEGYVEDLQKAMTKALTELETAKAYNAFIEDYFARVSKPIQKGAEPDEGWVEVQGDVKKGGVALPGEIRRTIIEDGKPVPAGAVRYQMPAEIYKRFQIIRKVATEASTVAQVMNNLNRYWRVNILFHPGSATTNLVSGGLQYSTKILTDFYTELLTGSVAFKKTRRNIFSMITAVTPKGWQEAPDWIYGGDLSNFYGQFSTEKTPGIKALDKGIDTYADNVLKVYGAVERYWKKVITLSEGGSKLGGLNQMTKEGLRLPTAEEKELLDAMNKEIDLYAYDYENVPVWLESYQQSGFAQAVKPFAKYPYKYAKQLTEMIGAAFDGTLPWQERVAKLLAVMTMVTLYVAAREKMKEKQKTAEVDINAPAAVSTSGRFFLGVDEEGREMFTRTAKYPFMNVTEAGAQLLEGNTNTGLQVLQDMMGGIAPIGHLALASIGYRSEYETFVPFPAMVGKDIASFVPGTRILADIAKFYDPYQRKPETFLQGITSLYPTTDEALQEKLHGEAKTIQVPLEGSITARPGEGTKRTTTDMLVENYKRDVLLGLLFGLYVKRIDPDVADAYVTRSEENAKEKEIKEQREALKKSLTQ